jgi:hypothetical protein
MTERTGVRRVQARDRRDAGTPARAGELTPARLAIATQRLAGNRATVALLRRALSPGRVLARRRLPGRDELEPILFDPGPLHPDATDSAAHIAGLKRLIELSEAEMTAAQKAQVIEEAHHGLGAAAWGALSDSERTFREAAAVTKVRKDTKMLDPDWIKTGPRPGTKDAANLTLLVNGANKILDRIATGAVDKHIAQVFGEVNVATAKGRYAKARTRLNELHHDGKILSERARYGHEVEVAGLTSHDEMLLSPETVDEPTSRESIVTCIHESMHAGNPKGTPDEVTDEGPYIDRKADFVVESAETKLKTASYFEVVPRRMLGMNNERFAYWGVTFTPGVLAPPAPAPAAPPAPAPAAPPAPAPAAPVVSQKQQAIGLAGDAYKRAWTTGLRVHIWLVWAHDNPVQWDKEVDPVHHVKVNDILPFWSKLERLTIHQRPGIKPDSLDPAMAPVTLIDIALSEAVTRQLAKGMDRMPRTEADANTLEATATQAERDAANVSKENERDLLIKLVARDAGSITDTPDRDLKVVLKMSGLMDEIDKKRAPADVAF